MRLSTIIITPFPQEKKRKTRRQEPQHTDPKSLFGPTVNAHHLSDNGLSLSFQEEEKLLAIVQ